MTRFDPHVARSLLCYELKIMCAGVSHRELGARLGVSRASFSQAMAGKNLFSRPALEVLVDQFGQRSRLPYLHGLLDDARSRPGPWSDRSGHGLAEGLRLTAASVVGFDVWTVNPVLRTPAYSAALGQEPAALGDAAVTWFAEECVLQRLAGSAESVISHLITLSESGALTPRIVPMTARPVPGLRTGFTLFDRDDGRTVVAEETNRGYYFADDTEAVAEYRRFLGDLDARAWDTARSKAHLVALRADLGTGGTGSAQPVSPVPGQRITWSAAESA